MGFGWWIVGFGLLFGKLKRAGGRRMGLLNRASNISGKEWMVCELFCGLNSFI